MFQYETCPLDITSYDCTHIHTHGQPQCTQEVEEVNLAVHGTIIIYLIAVMYACVHNIQISHTLNEGWGAQLHE